MVFWRRKRSEGFEWRDYVRTTILVRREQRRQKIKDVQAAAAEKVKDAGKRSVEAGVAGARSAGAGLGAGLKAASHATASGTKSFVGWSIDAAIRAAHTIGTGTLAAASGLGAGLSAVAKGASAPLAPLLEPRLARVRQPRLNLILKIIAVLTGLGAAYRTWAFGFDGDAIFATTVCVLTTGLLILAHLTDERETDSGEQDNLLERLRGHGFELPGRQQLTPVQTGFAVLGTIAVVAISSALYHYGAPVSLADLSSEGPVTTGSLQKPEPTRLEGRATAVTGDSLRLAGTNITLEGIEAPEATQQCKRANGKSWQCGTAAKETLRRLLRNRRITCEILGEADTGKSARCYFGEQDIAEELVRKGSVFADGGFWSSYASAEGEAQTEKAGLWAGEAERPQEYRDKLWQVAKEQAPDGCPIKGSIRSGSRTYVLPWSPNYSGIKLRTSRGERWFCTEDEALEAGWKPSTRS